MAPDPIFDIPALEHWGIATGIFGFMNSKWCWPAAESIHFIGRNLLIATVGMFRLAYAWLRSRRNFVGVAQAGAVRRRGLADVWRPAFCS